MAIKRLTEQDLISEISNEDVLHIVDVSDPSDNPAGSSKKVSIEQLKEVFDEDEDPTNWGEIEGTLSNQTDLQNALNEKVEEAPIDTKQYVRQDGDWAEVEIEDLDWDNISNKPTEFPPSSHTHTESDITDLDKYTQSQVDTLLTGKENAGVAQDIMDTHELAYDHDLIATALQEETDTLDSVTTRGNTTTNTIAVAGLDVGDTTGIPDDGDSYFVDTNIIVQNGSVTADAFITDGGDNTEVVLGDGTLLSLDDIGGGQMIYDAIVAPSDGDFTSLSDALASGAKTIYVKKGTYTETGSVQTTENCVIVGESRELSQITFSGVDGNGIFRLVGANTIVANLKLVGSGDSMLIGTFTGGSNVKILNCNISVGNLSSQRLLNMTSSTNAVIDNCTFSTLSNATDTLQFGSATNLTFTNNTFTDNTNNTNNNGNFLTTGTGTKLANNRFTYSKSTGITATGVGSVIENNTFTYSPSFNFTMRNFVNSAGARVKISGNIFLTSSTSSSTTHNWFDLGAMARGTIENNYIGTADGSSRNNNSVFSVTGNDNLITGNTVTTHSSTTSPVINSGTGNVITANIGIADNDAPDLSGYVPYTGATTNVDLGSNALTVGGNLTVGTTSSLARLTVVDSVSSLAKIFSVSSGSGEIFSVIPSVANKTEIRLSSNDNPTSYSHITAGVDPLFSNGDAVFINVAKRGGGGRIFFGGVNTATGAQSTTRLDFRHVSSFDMVPSSMMQETSTITGKGTGSVLGNTNSNFIVQMGANGYIMNPGGGTLNPALQFLSSLSDTSTFLSVTQGAFRFNTSATSATLTSKPHTVWQANDTSLMALGMSGNLGIGTTAPGAKLQVIGNGLFGANTSVPTATPINVSFGGTYGTGVAGSVANLKWDLYNDGANRYGIGMSAGLMEFQSPGHLAFFTGASRAERMRIDSTGNVGIGTTSPSAKTHILGTTEQLRVGYDTSNYFNATVGSTGTTTFNAVGSGSKFVFSDNVELTQTTTTETITPDTTITIVVNGNSYKIPALAI